MRLPSLTRLLLLPWCEILSWLWLCRSHLPIDQLPGCCTRRSLFKLMVRMSVLLLSRLVCRTPIQVHLAHLLRQTPATLLSILIVLLHCVSSRLVVTKRRYDRRLCSL